MFCRCYQAHVQWKLGEPEAAAEMMEEAIVAARDIAHPFSMAIALDYAVLILDRWLATSFRGERHAERIAQIEALERGESLL